MNDRFLIVTPSLSGGGAEKVAINLANEWARQGRDVHLTSIRDISDYSHILSGDVQNWFLGAARVRYSVPALRRNLRYLKPRFVLSVVRESNIILGLSAPKTKTTSVVYREASTLHDLGDKSRIEQALYLSLMRFFYKRADGVVANSADTLADLQGRGVTNVNASVIPNPVLPKEYYSLIDEDLNHSWFDNDSIEVILSVGRLHHGKDFNTLLQAFARLNKKRPQTRLVILGQGPEEQELKKLRNRLNLNETVSFYGFVTNPWPFYKKAKVFALASQWEGFGNVIVEALAAGTTVVTTDCPGGPRTITNNGEFGYLVPTRDHCNMASALENALLYPHNPQKLRSRANQFSAMVIARKYLAMFK